MNIAEFDWITTLNCFDVEDIRFRDIVKDTERWSKVLREEEGCDFVIALTHMRVPNDVKLAMKSTGVDIFLGGHDHIYNHQQVGQNLMVKSGCDYRNLSYIVIEEGTLTEEEKAQVPEEVINNEVVETEKTYFYQIKDGKYKV